MIISDVPFSSPKAAYHGVDSILQDAAGNFFLVEAKGGAGTLRNGQLGSDWIGQKIRKIISESDGLVSESTIARLEAQVESGNLQVMLTKTPIVDGAVQETQFWVKPLSQISDLSFFN